MRRHKPEARERDTFFFFCWHKQINTTLLALTARCVYCWERDVDDEIVGGQLGFGCGRVSFRQAMSVTHTGRLWAKTGIRGEQEGRGAISEAAPPCKSKSSMLLTCTHLPKVKIIQKNKPFTLVNGSVRCIAAMGGKKSLRQQNWNQTVANLRARRLWKWPLWHWEDLLRRAEAAAK